MTGLLRTTLVGAAAIATLVFRVLWLAERIRRNNKFELQIFSGKIFDGRDFIKKFV